MSKRFHSREAPISVVHSDRPTSFREPGSLPTAAKRAGVFLIASGVALNAWALFPNARESTQYVGLPEASDSSDTALASAMDRGQVDAQTPYHLVGAELAELKTTVIEIDSAAMSVQRTAAYPNLVSAVSRVPAKAKLSALLSLLDVKMNPEIRTALVAKLRSLLKLPDFVLDELLQREDLADFNKMLDAVFFGETDILWIQTQLDMIDVVPVSKTSDRIDVAGKPAYVFDWTAAVHSGDGRQGSALKPIPPSEPPQASMRMVAPSESETDVNTFAAAPAPSVSQDDQFTVSSFEEVPEPALVGLMAAPAPAPAPAPVAVPAPGPSPVSAPTKPATSSFLTKVVTLSTKIFASGNRFVPGTSSSPAKSSTSPTESPKPEAAPAPAAPPASEGPDNGPSNPPGGTGGENSAP
jgi:hypothetical protein